MPPAVVAGLGEDGPFTACGFPYDSRHALRWTKGPFVDYEQWDDGTTQLTTRQRVKSGYSGGGRFNRYGEYIGPISGVCGPDKRHMDKTYGSSGDGVQDFVAQFVGGKK